MTGRLSTTDVHLMLDNRFGGVAVSSPPPTYYVGLSTTAPTVDGDNVTEPSGGGYARAAIANNTSSWPAAVDRSKTNGMALTFPTASADWGTITHFVIYDSPFGGMLRAYGLLTSPVDVLTGETRSFPVGSIIISAPSS